MCHGALTIGTYSAILVVGIRCFGTETHLPGRYVRPPCDWTMPTTSLANEIGHRLRTARLTSGLTQRQLAEPEFTRGYVSQLENGLIRPSVKALHILARKLHRPVSWFLESQPSVDLPAENQALPQPQRSHRFALSEQELKLLRTFRRLPPAERRLLMTLAKRLAHSTTRPKDENRPG